MPRRTQSNMLAALSQPGALSKRPPPLPQHAGCKKGKASRCVLQVGVVVGGEVAHTHLASAHELSICRGAIPLAMTAAHMSSNDAAQKKHGNVPGLSRFSCHENLQCPVDILLMAYPTPADVLLVVAATFRRCTHECVRVSHARHTQLKQCFTHATTCPPSSVGRAQGS